MSPHPGPSSGSHQASGLRLQTRALFNLSLPGVGANGGRGWVTVDETGPR